jgi:hypothetical protein
MNWGWCMDWPRRATPPHRARCAVYRRGPSPLLVEVCDLVSPTWMQVGSGFDVSSAVFGSQVYRRCLSDAHLAQVVAGGADSQQPAAGIRWRIAGSGDKAESPLNLAVKGESGGP